MIISQYVQFFEVAASKDDARNCRPPLIKTIIIKWEYL